MALEQEIAALQALAARPLEVAAWLSAEIESLERRLRELERGVVEESADVEESIAELRELVEQLAIALDVRPDIDDVTAREIGEALEILSRSTEERWRALSAVAAVIRARPERVDHSIVRVFYGTNRDRTGRPDKNDFFGARRARELHLGACDVSIPHDRQMGELTSPRWWQTRENPSLHVILARIDELEERAFFAELSMKTAQSERREALVFVHGFKTTFADAVRRTGQVAYDLGFDGAPICFSWPTTARVRGYLADAAAVEWSIPVLEGFLEDLCRGSGAERIHLVAHSMGNRALAEALERIGLKSRPPKPLFRHVILAAPDIDAGVFENLAEALQSTAMRVTLYASSNDRALAVSEELHGAARAGSTRDSVLVVRGIDTVDASAVNAGFLGHSYFGDSTSVISDIFDLIRGEAGPPRKLLREAGVGLQYWTFR